MYKKESFSVYGFKILRKLQKRLILNSYEKIKGKQKLRESTKYFTSAKGTKNSDWGQN